MVRRIETKSPPSTAALARTLAAQTAVHLRDVVRFLRGSRVRGTVQRRLVRALVDTCSLAAAASDSVQLPTVNHPERWIDVVQYLAHAVPKRSVLLACRCGEIPGTRKLGRRWIARAADVDEWIDAHGNCRVVREARS